MTQAYPRKSVGERAFASHKTLQESALQNIVRRIWNKDKLEGQPPHDCVGFLQQYVEISDGVLITADYKQNENEETIKQLRAEIEILKNPPAPAKTVLESIFEKTNWFSPEQKPWESGYYEIRGLTLDWFYYWDNCDQSWWNSKEKTRQFLGGWSWRGLAKPPEVDANHSR